MISIISKFNHIELNKNLGAPFLLAANAYVKGLEDTEAIINNLKKAVSVRSS